MKKLQVIIIGIFLACNLLGCAGTAHIKKIETVKDVSIEKVEESLKERPRFQSGKRFIYLIAWNRIPVGRIIAEASDIRTYRDREAYVVKVVTESNRFLSKIYRVEDTYTSYIDAETMTSLHYEADRKEGNYRKHLVVEYDFEKMEAIYTNLTDGSVKKCAIEKNVQDPVSGLCNFMTLPAKPGEEVTMTVNLNMNNYVLSGKIEEIEVIALPELGAFPAFKIRPYVKLKGEKVDKGKAWMYFTADEKRFPLYGVVIIPFGRVTATLRSVEEIDYEIH